MEFLTKIWEFLCELPPCKIVNEDEGAIRLRFGKYRCGLGAGLHWRLPFVHEIIVINVREQVVDLPSQAINGQLIEAMISYEIEDVKKATLKVVDYDKAIVNYALGLIGSIVLENPGITGLELMEMANRLLANWASDRGMVILDFDLKTFTKGMVIKLLGEY